MTKRILVVTESKTGESVLYELSTNAIDINNKNVRQAIFKSLNQKYGKCFDTLEYAK